MYTIYIIQSVCIQYTEYKIQIVNQFTTYIVQIDGKPVYFLCSNEQFICAIFQKQNKCTNENAYILIVHNGKEQMFCIKSL